MKSTAYSDKISVSVYKKEPTTGLFKNNFGGSAVENIADFFFRRLRPPYLDINMAR